MFRTAIMLLTATLLGVIPGLPTAAAQQTRLTPISYRDRTLANGLRVLSIENHESPTVAIQVWYHVGSKDDPEGRSGFAHLFEHLMFKRTKNMKDEMLDRLTEDVGSSNNAFTADDVTVYHEVVPSNYLQTLLWAEADRLGSLMVNEANFKSERDVVKEEFRQRILAPPYGRFFYLIEQQSFTRHPYKRPGIGSIEELNAATIDDVRAFHRTFYRPDNATLIVAGDFEQKQLDEWIDKYFGRIPKPSGALPRVTVKEPERTAERLVTEYGANVPLPAVALTYLTPPKSSDDAFALRVAETIMAGGESSRLYRSLVYEQQIATFATGRADLREDPGLFIIGAALSMTATMTKKRPEDLQQALLAELKRMQTQPVTAAELDKAKNQLVTNTLRERETNEGKALALGDAAVVVGDARRVNTDVEKLNSVTEAAVRRIMQKYFSDTNRVVLYYLPESMRKNQSNAPQTGARGNASKTEATRQLQMTGGAQK